MKTSRIAAVSVAIFLIASLATPASAGKGSPKKPKPFEASGHVYLPGPLTWLEFFAESCPNLPASQGLSGFVVKLPSEMLNREDLFVEIEQGPGPGLRGGLSAAFFDLRCLSVGTEMVEGPLAVPEGTAFILIHDYFRANYDVTLRVTASAPAAPAASTGTPAEPDEPSEPPKQTNPASRTRLPFEATGHITAPGVLLITGLDFASSCPSMPGTQGLTGQIIEVPVDLRPREDLVVTATGGGELPHPDLTDPLRFNFFTVDCELSSYGQAPVGLPSGTAFIEVLGYMRADYDFTLTIQRFVPPGGPR